MLRALCLLCGVTLLATGQTPFDLAGVQLSQSGATEMAVTVAVLFAVFAAQE